MTLRVYDDNPAVVAPAFTRKAEGDIPFGKLVTKGTAAGSVKVTVADTDAVLGVAAPNAVYYAGDEEAQYDDEEVVTVKSLMSGKIYYLYANNGAGIVEGARITCSSDGDCNSISPGAGNSYKIIGIALEDFADNTWGRVLIL